MPRELHERLAAAAAERDVPMNLLINKAVERFLDNLVPLDELLPTRPTP